MDITVNRPEILKALQACATVAGKGTIVPVLADVLVAMDGERLRISATDLDLTLSLTCPALLREDGPAFTANLQAFAEFVRNLPDDSVNLISAHQVTGNTALRIEAGTTKFLLPVKRGDDFPTLPTLGDGPVLLTVDMATLADGYSAVTYAADAFALDGSLLRKGVLIKAIDGVLDFCSTDGSRMALMTFRTASDATFADVTPFRAARALAKIQHEGDAKFRETENHIIVEFGDRSMLAYKRLDMTFPDYKSAIPARAESELTLDRKRLAEAVHRARILTPTDLGMEITATAGRLTTRPMKAERGDGSDTMPYEGDGPLSAKVSAEYLGQALDAMKTEKVTLDATDRLVVLRSVADDLDGAESFHGIGQRSH